MKGDTRFIVDTADKVFTYIAENREDASRWVDEIKRVQTALRRHSNV
jgi:alkyl hydroperoxide reductase subunit AhpC